MSETTNQEIIQLQKASLISENLFKSPYYLQKFNTLEIAQEKVVELILKRLKTEESAFVVGHDYESSASEEMSHNENNFKIVMYEFYVDMFTQEATAILIKNIQQRQDYNELFKGVQNLEKLIIVSNNEDDLNQQRLEVFQEEIDNVMNELLNDEGVADIFSLYENLDTDIETSLENQFIR